MNEEETKKTKKVNILAYIGLMLMVAIIVVGVTYAMFTFQQSGTKKNQVVTGTLILTLNDGAGINVSNAFPTADVDGLKTPGYTFSIKNTGTLNSSYQIKVINDTALIASDGCSSKQLAWSKIKYSLTKNGAVGTPSLLSVPANGIIDTGVLNSGVTNNYNLKLWIEESTLAISGEHLHVKVQADSIVSGHTNFETGE